MARGRSRWEGRSGFGGRISIYSIVGVASLEDMGEDSRGVISKVKCSLRSLIR